MSEKLPLNLFVTLDQATVRIMQELNAKICAELPNNAIDLRYMLPHVTIYMAIFKKESLEDIKEM
jgi:hypothetical protein